MPTTAAAPSSTTDLIDGHAAEVGRPAQPDEKAPRAGAGYVRAFFALQAVGIFFLQKLGVPVGGGVAAQFIMIWLYMGLVLLFMSGRLKVDPVRTLLFTLTFTSVIVSTLLSGAAVSAPALMLILILYVPFVLTVFVSRAEYVGYLKIYQAMMVVISGIVVLQMAAQAVWSAAVWPNLDKLLPEAVLFPLYNNMNPVAYGSHLFKPNGVFLLEPSFVSQFAMIALVIELLFFRRLWALLAFGLAQMLSFSGSGLLIFAFAVPLLLPRVSPKLVLGGLVGLLLLGAVAGSVGWFDSIAKRATEFSQPGTSGRYRYVDPLILMAKTAENPISVVTGWGAGATREDSSSIISLTFTKIFTEYGLLTLVLFYAFAIRSVFVGAPSKTLAWMMFLYYNLGTGGFSLPIMVIPLFLLTALFRLRPEPTADLPGSPTA